MTFDEYMRDVVEEMSRKSVALRRDYAQHRPSAGINREDLVANFLRNHLPERFGVSTGLVISHDGMFSNEADLVVFDKPNNSPLYPDVRKKLWPVEALYALIEVKTQLNPRDLTDAISKFRKFKKLQRRFRFVKGRQNITESLAILWSFDSSSPETLKNSLTSMLGVIPSNERPDFVVVPGKLVVKSGSYLEISKLGQPNSPHRNSLVQRYGNDLSPLLPNPVEVDDLGDDSLMAWYVLFDSWLRQAGERFPDPIEYLPRDRIWGKRV